MKLWLWQEFESPDPSRSLNQQGRGVHHFNNDGIALCHRARMGRLEPPILADALEDAGCTNQDMLEHCRQPGEHVRGCWVVDLLLNKE
jgi:hypothetical protein